MPLLRSPRFQPGDLAAWKEASAADHGVASTTRHRRLVESTEERMVRWSRDRSGVVSVSWGKDSVVLAHMASQLLDWPLMYRRIWPLDSPHTTSVRDEFLAHYPVRYHEVFSVVAPPRGPVEHRTAVRASRRRAIKLFGPCRIMGVRAAESPDRELFRAATDGETKHTLSPMIDWTAVDVWAYLAHHDLPIHPAYGFSLSGAIARDQLRVSALGGERGRGHGRHEHEAVYYPELDEVRETGRWQHRRIDQD